MRYFLAAITAGLLLTVLLGCGGGKNITGGYIPGQIEESYAYTHGGYVGRALVKVADDGSLDFAVDEAFLPHTIAIVNIEDEGWNEDNTAYYLSRGNQVRVAKYVEYGGVVYVGVTVGGDLSYVAAGEAGEPAGDQDLELIIIRNQETMAAYFAGVQAGGFKTLSEFGGPATPVTTTTYGGMTKKTSPGYWNTGQTWAANIEAAETFAEENGVAFAFSEMVRASEADANGLRFWSVADAVTGATNADFKDYFGLMQATVGRLKTE